MRKEYKKLTFLKQGNIELLKHFIKKQGMQLKVIEKTNLVYVNGLMNKEEKNLILKAICSIKHNQDYISINMEKVKL